MKKYQYITSAVIFLIILASIFLVFTKPIEDGDLWWQMAYGKQMIENGTLIPDHTIYTWTPTRSEDIYCAWTAEILLYAIHSVSGMTGLYLLRYLLPLILIASVYLFARKLKVAANPVTGLAAVFFILSAGSPVSFIKPEMFSFFFMTLTALVWFMVRLKDSEERNGLPGNKLSSDRLVYFFPLIFLLWVNTHGGFIFGLPLLALVFIGDLINKKFNPDEALSDKTRKHLFIASALSGLALFITPYGYKYPISLLTSLATQSVEELKTVGAYAASLDVATPLLYFIIQVFILVFLLIASKKRKKPDAALILVNLFYAFLYTKFLRTTYFWSPVFVFSAVWLLKDEDIFEKIKRPFLKVIYVSVVLLLALDMFRWSSYQALVNSSSWLGYGNYYINTPEETLFIQKNFKNMRIGNVYNNGGYLLWMIAPKTRIMIDPRYFPFKNWYNLYVDFQTGKNINQFLSEFDCDIFSTHYGVTHIINYLLSSPDWSLVFYGSGGPIFIKRNLNTANQVIIGSGLHTIQNVNQANMAFDFCVTIGDWDSSKKIIKNLKMINRWDWEQTVIIKMQNYLDGVDYYYSRDYKSAIKNLELCQELSFANNTTLQKTYNISAVDLWTADNYTGTLKLIELALKLNTEDPYTHFNNGVILWWKLKKNEKVFIDDLTIENAGTAGAAGMFLKNTSDIAAAENEKSMYEKHLKKFLDITKNIKGADEPRRIAQMILDGKYNKKPPLIHPAEPVVR